MNTGSHGPVTVLIDDARDFKDGRPAVTARTSAEALALLRALAETPIEELWLDYDLVGDDTAQPVVDYLLACAASGSPLPVQRLHVHTSNLCHGHRITVALAEAGYPARRNYAANIWRRAVLPEGHVWA